MIDPSFEQIELSILLQLGQKIASWEAPNISIGLKDKSSLWRVSSALQKSIRRGRVEDALKYATAIYNSTEKWYLWTSPVRCCTRHSP
jgi:replication-associated recombination protein RarA